MKKWILLLSLVGLVSSCFTPRQAAKVRQDQAPASSAAAKKTDESELRYLVQALAHDSMAGRFPGTEGERKAANLIATKMMEYGLMGAGNDDSFFQPFSYRLSRNPHNPNDPNAKLIYATNVVGFYNNAAPYTVIIGAHYDHLGRGEIGSRAPNSKEVHNGADDNASGVAALLLLARRAHKLPKNYNYLFIAFSGEEAGLRGSKYYADHPTIQLSKVAFMINMDMVGRMRDDKLIVNGVGTSPFWKEVIHDKNPIGLNIVAKESGVGPSDHTSFYLKNIPVLHLFTGQHKDYHKPSDDVEYINWQGIMKVVQFVEYIINSAKDKGKLAFTKTKDESQNRAASFKVTLGVMPDYAYEGKGMRIDAVIDGRPAAKAGIQGGDIITRIGDMEIKNIYDYMKALSSYNKGDSTTVTVKRKDQTLQYKVTF